MKWFRRGIIGLCLCGGLFAEGVPVEVRMLNGDAFSGEFRELDTAGYFRVLPAWEDGVLRFHAAYTGRLRFLSGHPAEWGMPDTRVHFVNGDRISGRLISLSDAEVVLETGWGSRLRANRPFVKSLEILPGEGGVIFRGMTPLSDWSVRMPPEHEGVLRENAAEWWIPANGRLSRTLPLPDAGGVLLEMEISFPDGTANATVDLFQSPVRNRPLEGVSLSLNPNWLHVRAQDGHGRQNWLLREPLPPEAVRQRLRMSVHLNVETSEVTLQINGMEVPPFTLHTERALPGRTDLELVLLAARDTAGVTVHALEFTKRTGASAPDMGGGDSDRDWVVFGNGDRMEARVLSMDAEGLLLQVDGGREVPVPRARIQAVRLATRPSIHPRRRERDVAVDLVERGDRLTLALSGFSTRSLSGSSDLWREPPELPTGAVRELRLNVYQGMRHDDSHSLPPLYLFER